VTLAAFTSFPARIKVESHPKIMYTKKTHVGGVGQRVLKKMDSLDHPSTWSVNQVASWLESLGPGLAEYQSVFVANDIDGTVLDDLSVDFLETLGIKSLGHRLKVCRAL